MRVQWVGLMPKVKPTRSKLCIEVCPFHSQEKREATSTRSNCSCAVYERSAEHAKDNGQSGHLKSTLNKSSKTHCHHSTFLFSSLFLNHTVDSLGGQMNSKAVKTLTSFLPEELPKRNLRNDFFLITLTNGHSTLW